MALARRRSGVERFRHWARRELSARQRLLVILPQVVLVYLLVPAVIVVVGPRGDRWLGLPGFGGGPLVLAFGAVLALAGAALSVWAVYTQHARGRGTPAPMAPTQELVVEGPYRHTRNPMITGGTLFLLGVGLLAGTTAGLSVAVAFLAVQVVYIKAVEERELAARFGDDYRAYRASTPFLLPRPWRDDE